MLSLWRPGGQREVQSALRVARGSFFDGVRGELILRRFGSVPGAWLGDPIAAAVRLGGILVVVSGFSQSVGVPASRDCFVARIWI